MNSFSFILPFGDWFTIGAIYSLEYTYDFSATVDTTGSGNQQTINTIDNSNIKLGMREDGQMRVGAAVAPGSGQWIFGVQQNTVTRREQPITSVAFKDLTKDIISTADLATLDDYLTRAANNGADNLTLTEIAFIDSDVTLFYINLVVDIYFLVDLLVNFNLAFYDRERDRWVLNLWPIAVEYIKGWFFLDLISCFPFEAVVMLQSGATFGEIFMYSNDRHKSGSMVIRMAKLLRLPRLLRMLRFGRVISRLASKVNVSFKLTTMLKYTALLLVTTHLFACMIRLVGAMCPQYTSLKERNSQLYEFDHLNIHDLNDNISIDSLTAQLVKAYTQKTQQSLNVLAQPISWHEATLMNHPCIQQKQQRLVSYDWVYGKTLAYEEVI